VTEAGRFHMRRGKIRELMLEFGISPREFELGERVFRASRTSGHLPRNWVNFLLRSFASTVAIISSRASPLIAVGLTPPNPRSHLPGLQLEKKINVPLTLQKAKVFS